MSEQRDARESVSGSVLHNLINNPIDPGYSAGIPTHADAWWKRLISLVTVAILTMLAVWAAADLREARTATESSMDQLREQVESRIELHTAVLESVDELRADLDELHASALPQDPESAAAAENLRLAASASAVAGSGITVALDDSQASTANERLRDFDLQVLTNALWAGGAEAIDINGQRLAASSAIRSAGSAILVNLTPLVPPYVVSAIGDPIDLQVNLARSGASTHLATLRETFGVRVSIDAHDSLELPAARDGALRFAQEVP